MNFKKLALATATIGLLGGLYGCSDGDETSILIEGDTTNNTTNPGPGPGPGTGGLSECPAGTSALAQVDGMDACAITSAETITEDMSLPGDTIYFFGDNSLTVGNGSSELAADGTLKAAGDPLAHATLRIGAGAQLKFKKGAYLLVTRGSKIMAEGTAEKPIIFSSEDEGYDGSEEWGGVIIQGFGTNNVCDQAADECNILAEGIPTPTYFGGYDPEDDSGIFQYVIIAEGGFKLDSDNEINGLSLGAVGSKTQIDHVQVNGNSDDGIELFGGNVNLKYLVLTGNDDDSLDWDEGYRGSIQYVLVKQAESGGDKVIEADTYNSSNSTSFEFYSTPVVANATFIGAGVASTMVALKEGTGGFFVNSIFAATTANLASCVTVSGSDAQANRTNGNIAYVNVIADCPAFGDDMIDQASVFAVAADLGAMHESGAAEASLAAPLSWTEFSGTYSNASVDADFLEETDYLGAIAPDATEAWWDGWILEGTL